MAETSTWTTFSPFLSIESGPVSTSHSAHLGSRDKKSTTRAKAPVYQHLRRRQSKDAAIRDLKQDHSNEKSSKNKRPRKARPYEVQMIRLDPWAAQKTSKPRTHPAQQETKLSKAQAIVSAPRAQNAAPDATYQFLTWSDPQQTTSAQHKKRVRSHVAKATQSPLKPSHHVPEKVESAESSQATTSSDDSSSDTLDYIEPAKVENTNKRPRDLDHKPNIIALSQCYLLTSPCQAISANTYSYVIGRGTMAMSQVIVRNGAQHIGQTLDRAGCDIKLVMDHYLFILNHQMYKLDEAVGMETQKNLRVIKFMRFVFSDTALFLSMVLLGMAHRLGRQACSKRAEILRMRMAVVAAINGALSDSRRATSDAVIYSVATIATYEAVLGDPGEYSVHMAGLRRMVDLRGGVDDLGLMGILKISLLWMDVNCAHLLKLDHVFPEEDLPDPDLFSFLAGLEEAELPWKVRAKIAGPRGEVLLEDTGVLSE